MSLTKKEGFTLIEMLIVVAILGILVVMGSAFLMTSMSSAAKAEITKEIRQNGDNVLSTIQSLIISASKLDCAESPNAVSVYDYYDAVTRFSCSNNTISSNSASLTGGNVYVDPLQCSFSCTNTPGVPTKVSVSFNISQLTDDPNLRASEKANMTFTTNVIARNAK